MVTSRASLSAASPSVTIKSTCRAGLTRANCGADRARNARQIDRRALKFAARDLRQCQHVVDELRHLLRRFPHISQILLAVVVELVGIVLEQSEAEAVDAAQRRAQIVRHRIAEGFQLLVLGLELGDELGAFLRHLAGGARFDRFEFGAQQLLANAPRLVLELLAPDLRQHAGAQQIEVARFGDVVVGAGAKALDHCGAVLDRREHHHRDIADARRAFDALAGFAAADAGHHQIEQHAIDRLHRQQLQRLLAGARQNDFVAFGMQRFGKLLQIGFAVVDG